MPIAPSPSLLSVTHLHQRIQPPTYPLGLANPPQFLAECYFDKNVFYCIRVILVWWILGWNFGTVNIVYDWPQKRSGTVYIYIIFRIYSEIKTFRPFIGAFHVFLRKHVPEKLIAAQSVSVSTYSWLLSLCFDKTHGIEAIQKSN